MPFAPWQYGVFDCPLLQVVEHLIAGDAAVTDDLFGIAEAIHLGRVDVAHPEIDATRRPAIASARLPSSMYRVPWPIAGTSRAA
jgi:hypothetical protein